MDYDDHGRVSHATNIIDYLVSSTVYNASASTYYQYNSDGTLEYEDTSFTGGGSIRSNYSYDELLRPTSISSVAGSFNHTVNYTYYSNSTKTENLISTYTSTVNGIATTFGYTYDSKGNITKITNSRDDDITYTYDDLGQLTKEVKGNVTKTYTYDNAGNIKSITTTTEIESLDPDPGFTPIIKAVGTLPKVTTTTKTLSYGNSQWGDLLTSYDGTAITYDEIGNPLSYYNGSSYTFTWEGRRLVGAVKGTKTMSFAYNDEGIRTSKTVNGVETAYYVNGGQIVAEKTGTRTIVYIYDASGAPIGMMYRTTSYAKDVWDTFWYEKNLQGDIIAIYNASGTKVATYTYSDAWGNHSVSYSNGGGSTGAQYNPFRYRGYYYDADLGMYYLQSRYYDAKICRFISADYASVTTATPYALTDKNLYAYCDNNPVMRIDKTGCIWNILIGAGVGAVLGAISSIASQLLLDDSPEFGSPEFLANVGLSAAAGMISGGLAATIVPVAGQMIGNAIIGGLTGYFEVAIKDHYSGSKSTLATYALSIVDGALIGLIAGRIGGDGSASKHVSNSFWRTVHGKSNIKYYFTQINTQAARDGLKAIPSILKAALPSIVDIGIHRLYQ